MEVALGGTFDPIHDGHRKLFRNAVKLGDVTIGLTADSLAPKTRHEERYIRPFERRKAALEAELSDLAVKFERDFEVRKLTDPTGIATEAQFDALTVSPETKDGGERINEIRVKHGHNALRLVVVDPVFAEDGERVSSTRIVKGEIDEHGNLTPERTGRGKALSKSENSA